MNIVDVAIVLLILSFGILGAKRGVIKEVVCVVGTVLCFILAFYLKNPLAEFLSLKLPFFNFTGVATGLTSLNIIMYQMISFIIVLVLLFIVLEILIKISAGLEKILKATVVLGIPSRILGFIAGLIEGYTIVFIALFFLYQPIINSGVLDGSKLMPKILSSSPVLSQITNKTRDAIMDIYNEIDENDGKNTAKTNLSILKLMMKYEIIDQEYLKKIQDADKINIAGMDALIRMGV